MADTVEVEMRPRNALLVALLAGFFVGGGAVGSFNMVTGPTGLAAADTSGSGDQGGKTVTVSGTEYSFSPSTITVEKGQEVTIEFTNTGQIPHNLKIPALNVGSDTIQAGQTDSFTFTAPESGTFPIDFECTLPGHASSGMTGTLQASG
ncbi:MAG: cupredoxin domain-containing protein [Candidatus Nanohaloarchaea archaeon]|nr:cupredoxin domain-containing protein [Candidatus Nanohaloarchaea archaeon]